MMDDIRIDAAYAPSEAIVAQMIEGELVIVPLAAAIGDIERDVLGLATELVRRKILVAR